MGAIPCLRALLKQLARHGIRAKAAKTDIKVESLKFLSGDVSRQGIIPNEEKIKKIRGMDRPRSQREIKTVTGSLQYFRKACPACSTVEGVLHELTKKGASVDEWGEKHDMTFWRIEDYV